MMIYTLLLINRYDRYFLHEEKTGVSNLQYDFNLMLAQSHSRIGHIRRKKSHKQSTYVQYKRIHTPF